MQWIARLLLLAPVVLVGAGGWGPGRVDQFMRIAADQVDPALPDQPLGLWINRQLLSGAVVRTSIEVCGATPGDCLVVDADIVSRARRLVLIFDLETNTFVGGSLGAPDMEPMPPITSLAELPRRLTAPIRPFPLDCPEGTRLRLKRSMRACASRARMAPG